MAFLEFENVSFTYDGRTNALDGLTLSIERGSFTCVLGGNGSGKSTLAKHANALLVPDSGHVLVDGMDTADEEHLFDIRSRVGMVFQNPDDQIVASLVEDDVAFGPENLGVEPSEIRQRVTEALLQVGMQGFERRETFALSGGQKQRVAIAGVLACKPQLIVFDESSAMLDPRGRSGLLRVCRELNAEGIAIVFITHFMEEAAYADRVSILDQGKIVLDGAPDDVLVRTDILEGLSLEVPFAAQFSRLLAERGIDVGMHVSEDELIDSLIECAQAQRGGAL